MKIHDSIDETDRFSDMKVLTLKSID